MDKSASAQLCKYYLGNVKAGGVDTVGPLLALASSIEEGEGDTKILGNELKGKSHDNLIFVR